MKLAKYRKENSISQKTVADFIGRHVTTVSKYETGDACPSLDTAVKIRTFTNGQVDVEDFIGENDDTTNGKSTKCINSPSAQAI